MMFAPDRIREILKKDKISKSEFLELYQLLDQFKKGGAKKDAHIALKKLIEDREMDTIFI